jgi:hypothetical protein
MRELAREALLKDVRRWMVIESPTGDIGAVNRIADHAEAARRGLEASIERIAGTEDG